MSDAPAAEAVAAAGDRPRALAFLARTSVRFARQHPGQFGLGLAGIVLGIAAVVAIDIAVASSQRAFTLSVQAVVGNATHRIVGNGFGIDETLYRDLRLEHGFRELAPVVEVEALRLEPERAVVTVIGVDPYAEASFRSWQPSERRGDDPADRDGDWLTKLVVRPGTCVIADTQLAELGVAVGDSIALRIGGRVEPLRIVGTLTAASALDARRFASLILTDIATAQELVAAPGVLSRIDAIATADADADRLRALLPAGTSLESAGRRQQALQQMTAAFDLNLRSLSLLALLVGWFLIDNTMSFSVVQRRGVFGRLRTLGVTRGQLFRLVLLEGIGFGVVGALLGSVLGVVLGRALVEVVAGAIGDLYFAVEVAALAIPPWTLAKGALLGICASLIAAWRPAREASSTDARDVLRRSSLERRLHASSGRRALLGLAAFAVTALLIALPSRQIWVGYAGLFFLVLGFASLTPLAVRALVRVALPLAGASVVRRYAVRSIERHLSRTAFAIAALSVAIAMAIGVGIMVSSFRGSVVDWLDATLAGDVYIGLDGTVSRRGNREPLDSELCQRVFALDGVVGALANRRFEVRTAVGAVELNVRQEIGAPRDVTPIIAALPAPTAGASRSPAVWASEPFLFHHQLRLGDQVEIATARGPVDFEIRQVFRDYVSDMGYLTMTRDTYERYWDDRSYTALALFLEEAPQAARDAPAAGARVEAVIAAVREIASDEYGADLAGVGFICASRQALRNESLRIFDRTFRITDVLRLLATLVAMVGVASAFMALLLERTREFGILRAAGMTPGGVLHLTTTQSAVMGGIAGVLAIPLGIAFAAILTLVVNRRSFGWSLDLSLDAGVIGVGVVTSLMAALLAGALPAWRVARLEPADALRDREG